MTLDSDESVHLPIKLETLITTAYGIQKRHTWIIEIPCHVLARIICNFLKLIIASMLEGAYLKMINGL
jgi:hypothetical protein